MVTNGRLLQVEKVNAGYGHLQVLWDISLYVAEGEFVALLGPNGAGKTTTLRTIAGLIKPLSGTIKFREQSISGIKTDQISRMGISFIPEELNLFTGMSVYENLLLGAFAARDRKQIGKQLEMVFGLFPVLKERSHQLAGTLSGGERKMLGIARGLMSNPRILLVDEPSLGLAPKLVLAVFDVLQELNRRGVTILLVEQNVNTTLHITTRSYVLEHGRIVLEGPSRELLENEHVKKSYLGM